MYPFLLFYSIMWIRWLMLAVSTLSLYLKRSIKRIFSVISNLSSHSVTLHHRIRRDSDPELETLTSWAQIPLSLISQIYSAGNNLSEKNGRKEASCPAIRWHKLRKLKVLYRDCFGIGSSSLI